MLSTTCDNVAIVLGAPMALKRGLAKVSEAPGQKLSAHGREMQRKRSKALVAAIGAADCIAC
jgi:hypothetical protein